MLLNERLKSLGTEFGAHPVHNGKSVMVTEPSEVNPQINVTPWVREDEREREICWHFRRCVW